MRLASKLGHVVCLINTALRVCACNALPLRHLLGRSVGRAGHVSGARHGMTVPLNPLRANAQLLKE
jgi:hypothetical protein